MSDNQPQLISVGNGEVQPLLCPVGEVQCLYQDELAHLRQEVKGLAQQVRTDALTGLYNFRFLNEALPMEMERTRRSGQPLSMILLDIDHFKQFNDRWGHESGNEALVHVARLINLTLRKLDLPCRYGGEEFVVILPNTDLHQAVGVAERLRETIESTQLNIDGENIFLTASLGADEFKAQHPDTADNLLRRVDAWLYTAKKDGRNRVACPDLAKETLAVTSEEKEALFGSEDIQ